MTLLLERRRSDAVVLRNEDRESEYSRNRMHAFECDRSQSGERIWIGRVCKRAKQYLSDALEFKLDLGAGSGPMNHAFAWNRNE